jgi:chromosome segregation protein
VFLKSLSLKGFKSFADATTLEMEPGVTVVVGPNGSGKSNVVDAIAWVLGAQAPSAVRSQKMDDVIFAGTAKRPALGRAEVSLCIDNSSGILPIDFEEVTITRTLFRDGDSEYAMNGVPCRLLDIQELLSDSGVGRQQHVIVSQGQIDAVLNARPEDRKAVIEEAAGVLKYRRRREKAQRRLRATEENLTRVQDLLREVRRQLRPLERQADAARRHGDLVAELTALRRHLAGREIVALRATRASAQQGLTSLEQQERSLTARLRSLDEEISAAEEQLSATGADDIGDRLARVEGLWERARGLQALLGERISGLERERDASVDQGVIETLEAETARLGQELEDVDATIEALAPDSARVEARERQIAEQRSLFEQESSEAPEAPVAEAGELRGRLAVVVAAVADLERADGALRERLDDLTEARQRLGATEADLEERSKAVEAEITSADERRRDLAGTAEDAVRRLAETEQALGIAAAELQAWAARADALQLALDEARERSGADLLAGIDGVRGTLLDLVDIDEGWESAFEAAAGQAMAAAVVADVGSARDALGELRRNDLAGGVLALGGSGSGSTPASMGSLRAHVRSSLPEVEALLDLLVGSVEVVDDWRSGVAAALADPRIVYVTRDGDRFATDGWRVGLTGSGATGAALDEARERCEAMQQDVDRLGSRRDSALVARDAAVSALEEVDSTLAELRPIAEQLRARLASASGDARAATVTIDAVRAQRVEVARDLAARHEERRVLAEALPRAEASERAALERSRELDETRRQIDREAAEVGARKSELEVRVAAVEERRQFLRARLEELEERLARHADQRARAGERRARIDERLALAELLSAVVAERASILEHELAELRTRRQAQSETARAAAVRLDRLRSERSSGERELAAAREQSKRRELEVAEANLRLETVIEALRADLDCEPAQAVQTECPPLEGTSPKERVRELERELRIMGPINPLALEEYEALSERHQFLVDQLDDVRSSRRELNKVVRAIDEEIVTVFSAAFADVAVSFEKLFSTLFPGGVGRLRLTQPDNLLETGIEIEAKPSGKNVKKLSLLSGGERSLTALAFLFSVFRSRPSPFYVMDEVEAALDDVNLHRFLQLVHEFRDDAQLIIVSHQKRTMEAADCLYGITMQPGGSSRAVSEKPGAVGPAEIDLRTPGVVDRAEVTTTG